MVQANFALALIIDRLRTHAGRAQAARTTRCGIEAVGFNKFCVLCRRDHQLCDAHAAPNGKSFGSQIDEYDL